MIDRSGFIQVGWSSQTRVIAASAAIALLACVVEPAAHATPSIKVLSEVAYDGPIKYTVKMASKNWGSAQETRTIRSGQTDDFTWQSKPAGGSLNVPDACPDVDAIRNASGTTVRQVKIRFAAVVASSGDADVQLSFQGHAPRPASAVIVGGKSFNVLPITSLARWSISRCPPAAPAKTSRSATAQNSRSARAGNKVSPGEVSKAGDLHLAYKVVRFARIRLLT